MDEITPNYMLGLIVLVVSFILTFYVPIAYFWFKARRQRNQNK